MTSTFRVMKFNYKLVYTPNVQSIEIESCKTISNLITELKTKSRELFNININYDIEIVEAGNDEMSPKLEPSQITLQEKYGDKCISFYIRPVIRGVFIRSMDYSNYTSQH